MNQAVNRRQQIALDLIQLLPDSNQPHPILIGGSVAKGWADDFSDLELCFCWDSLPSPAAEQKGHPYT